MNIEQILNKVNRDLFLLAPFVREYAIAAIRNCHDAGYLVEVFEGYRSPVRQDALYMLGRTVPGAIVTRSKAWQSWHQFGCAVDIAYMIKGRWTWKDCDFDKPAQYFLDQGFDWFPKLEKVHYEMTSGMKISEAQQIVFKYGMQALWLEIESNL